MKKANEPDSKTTDPFVPAPNGLPVKPVVTVEPAVKLAPLLKTIELPSNPVKRCAACRSAIDPRIPGVEPSTFAADPADSAILKALLPARVNEVPAGIDKSCPLTPASVSVFAPEVFNVTRCRC